jgi:ABC-type molybdate transport system substrate-binding protein
VAGKPRTNILTLRDPPIIYPIALTKESSNPDAQAFLNYIRSPAARPAFDRQGFTVLQCSRVTGRP